MRHTITQDRLRGTHIHSDNQTHITSATHKQAHMCTPHLPSMMADLFTHRPIHTLSHNVKHTQTDTHRHTQSLILRKSHTHTPTLTHIDRVTHTEKVSHTLRHSYKYR